jgi:hypothetical protein
MFYQRSRIELAPLPEYAIREIMVAAALERGISLKNSDLSKLQERAGGNPMLAQRAVDEEYLVWKSREQTTAAISTLRR